VVLDGLDSDGEPGLLIAPLPELPLVPLLPDVPDDDSPVPILLLSDPLVDPELFVPMLLDPLAPELPLESEAPLFSVVLLDEPEESFALLALCLLFRCFMCFGVGLFPMEFDTGSELGFISFPFGSCALAAPAMANRKSMMGNFFMVNSCN
jgi:hypothetical protein